MISDNGGRGDKPFSDIGDVEGGRQLSYFG